MAGEGGNAVLPLQNRWGWKMLKERYTKIRHCFKVRWGWLLVVMFLRPF